MGKVRYPKMTNKKGANGVACRLTNEHDSSTHHYRKLIFNPSSQSLISSGSNYSTIPSSDPSDMSILEISD
jgi:hypothetical protein